MAKFREATPTGSKVLAANALHFEPILDHPLKKFVMGTPIPVKGVLKTWSFSRACKNLGVQHPLGAEI